MRTDFISKANAITVIKNNLEDGNSIPMTDEGTGAAGTQFLFESDPDKIDKIVAELQECDFFNVLDPELRKSIISEMPIEDPTDANPIDYDYLVSFKCPDRDYTYNFLLWI